MKALVPLLLCLAALAGCYVAPSSTHDGDLDPDLVRKGRLIFFNETFGGNGRTCGTCHPSTNNFAIDPAFIAGLPDHDPLFVAEFTPALGENFENDRLLRERGLILENLDGFEDLDSAFVLRGVPHVLGLTTSVASAQGPRTGWSGDGAPGDGSLRSFATGAVIQHFPKTLRRIAGRDFRLPTDKELDAIEAFMLSLGRKEDPDLPLTLRSVRASRGQEVFLSRTEGKCAACHFDAGANGDPAIFGPDAGNLNFDNGVENLPDQPQDLTGELVPPDDGLGTPGDRTFNTPSLVEAADTGPFFHNNAIETIEGAVAFYNTEAFNNSPAGQLVREATGSGIALSVTQVEHVAAFLRVVNALENIRQTIELLEPLASRRYGERRGSVRVRYQIEQAVAETRDAIEVLEGAELHPESVVLLRKALRLIKLSTPVRGSRSHAFARDAIKTLRKARAGIVGERA
jgi:hypothetical protein